MTSPKPVIGQAGAQMASRFTIQSSTPSITQAPRRENIFAQFIFMPAWRDLAKFLEERLLKHYPTSLSIAGCGLLSYQAKGHLPLAQLRLRLPVGQRPWVQGLSEDEP